jgi:hypothetical protein
VELYTSPHLFFKEVLRAEDPNSEEHERLTAAIKEMEAVTHIINEDMAQYQIGKIANKFQNDKHTRVRGLGREGKREGRRRGEKGGRRVRRNGCS